MQANVVLVNGPRCWCDTVKLAMRARDCHRRPHPSQHERSEWESPPETGFLTDTADQENRQGPLYSGTHLRVMQQGKVYDANSMPRK